MRVYALVALGVIAAAAYLPAGAAGISTCTSQQGNEFAAPPTVNLPTPMYTRSPATVTASPISTATGGTYAATPSPTLRATATAGRLLPTATSIYGSPYGSGTWGGFFAQQTTQASYYASLTPANPTGVSATPTTVGASGVTATVTPSPTSSPSVTVVSGVTRSPTRAATPSASRTVTSSLSPQLSSASPPRPTQIAMAPEVRQPQPTADVQPELLIGVKTVPEAPTVSFEPDYYARRLGNVVTLGSALLLLAGGVLGTVALIVFVIAQLDR